jgi:hypothetical protein
MSALPPKADIKRLGGNVPLCANSEHRARLFDHLVGAGKHGCRYRQAEHLGGLEIDDRFELGRCAKRRFSFAPYRV